MNSSTQIDIGRAMGRSAGSLGSRMTIGLGAAAADFAAVAAIVVGSHVLYHALAYGDPGNLAVASELVAVIGGLFVFINLLQRRYRISRYLNAKGQLTEAFNAWNVTFVAFIAVAFLVKRVDDYSRAAIVLTYLVGAPLITLARWHVVKVVLRWTRAGRIAAQRVLLVGGKSEIISFISRHVPWNMGLVIQDAIALREPRGRTTPEEAEAMLVEDLAKAQAQARAIRPDAVFIALPWSDQTRIERCVEAFMNVPVAINLAPEQIIERFDNPRIVRSGAVPSLELCPTPLTSPAIVLKRVFDMGAAALLLLAVSPLFAVIAALIRLDSRGPVFFLQRRYGFNQQPFRIIKFRTMRTMDDGDVVRQATANDPRITKVGAWLRRWNLDELPQLVNVLMGQMSLVGPRPHALAHDREFEAKIARYARRHNVKPGITGWAQVNGLRGETDTDDKMAQRVAHDLWYIDNWNFWLDLVIMIRTVVSPKAFRNAK